MTSGDADGPTGPGDDSELLAEVTSAANELAAVVQQFVLRREDREFVPPTIFHFTDADGLRGILTTKTLRASLATSLNDTSETKYALSRLRRGIKEGSIPLTHLRPDVLRNRSAEGSFCQDTATITPGRLDFRTYICSFCGGWEEAVHWLHYGRSGTGVALGFDSQGLLDVPQFPIFPAIYNLQEQDEFLAAVVKLVDDCAGRFAAHESLLGAFFTDLAVDYVRYAAPQFKHPAFRSEDEWRLISSETRIEPAGEPTGPTKFRTENGRIVPYKEIAFETLPLRAIVLGASSPMKTAEQALAVLLEESLGESLGKAIRIIRSDVPIRP